MAFFCNFTSGSRGNSGVYLDGSLRVLIDAGTNTKYIASCLRELGLTTQDLTHVVITHAHSDHVSALPVLMKHTDARLVCTEGTYFQLKVRQSDPLLFWEGESFALGDLQVRTAPTPHDCFGSCCYAFGEGEHGLAYCTDMGVVTADIFALMRSCGNLFIESNHDVDMLKNGPYPWPLKERVLSKNGHLSNADCAAVVGRLAANGTRRVMLGHLSETNNRPDIAVHESETALDHIGARREVLLGAAAALRMQRPVDL